MRFRIDVFSFVVLAPARFPIIVTNGMLYCFFSLGNDLGSSPTARLCIETLYYVWRCSFVVTDGTTMYCSLLLGIIYRLSSPTVRFCIVFFNFGDRFSFVVIDCTVCVCRHRRFDFEFIFSGRSVFCRDRRGDVALKIFITGCEFGFAVIDGAILY